MYPLPAVGAATAKQNAAVWGHLVRYVVHQALVLQLIDLSMEIRLTLIARLATVPDMPEHPLRRFQRPQPASGQGAGAASQ